MSQVEEFHRIPVGALQFSQTTAQKERRAHFSKTLLEELVASVSTVGIMQPIVVRRIDGADKYEVCAGERRVLAAKQAGLQDVPAMVRDITDEQLLQFQLIENLQREGLHELAEAEGYEQLIKKFGMTTEQVIAKVGKTRSYVYGRLRLTALCKEGRDAFYEGLLNASTALDLARIPVEALQKQALKEITKPKGGDQPLSVRAAREHIQANYMLRLNGVGFAPDDATLVPKAGACGPCGKRTGNNQDLFGDVKGTDVCTDTICFRLKIAARAGRLIEEAKKTGQKVIAGAAAVKKIAPHGLHEHSYLEGYVRLDGTSYDHGNKKYSAVLGPDYVPTLLQNPDTGEIIKIAPRGDIPKPKRKGGSSGGGSSSGQTRESRNAAAQDQAKEALKKALERRCRMEVFRAVFAKAPKKVERATVEAMVIVEIENAVGPSEEFYELLGLPQEARKTSIETTIKAMGDAELMQLAAVATVVDEATGTWGGATRLNALAKQYRVDPAKIRNKVAADMKAEAKAAATRKDGATPTTTKPAAKKKAKASTKKPAKKK
jgi:ParB/RepB/Spo0J family partition protein